MLQFVGIAFQYLLPFVLLAWVLPFVHQKWLMIRVMTIMHFSLLFYAVFLIRQLIGLWQLSNLMGIDHQGYRPSFMSMLPILLLIVLPFFFLSKGWLNKIWAAILCWILILIQQGFTTMIDQPIYLLIKILFYLSLLTALYALVWLYKKFSDQSVY